LPPSELVSKNGNDVNGRVTQFVISEPAYTLNGADDMGVVLCGHHNHATWKGMLQCRAETYATK
jgi:homospermidine synthase